MATVYRENKERSKRQYISTAAFDKCFFTYVVSTNQTTFATTGTLSANVTGASAAQCPAGRILRETGRRLFPGAHPGVVTLMVAVYDNISLLSGFIDPNSNMFAVFNSDKPWEVVDGTDLSGGLVHRGQSVFTSGNVTAVGSVISGGPVYSSTQTTITFTNSTSDPGNQILIDTTKGNTFISSYSPGSSTALTANIRINTGRSVGGVISPQVPAAGVTITLIFTTNANVTNGSSFTFVGTSLYTATAITMSASAAIAASKTYVFTFVSNGTNLINTSSVTI